MTPSRQGGDRNSDPVALAELYRRWRGAPGSVSLEWAGVFERIDDEGRAWLESLGTTVPATIAAGPSGDATEAARDSIRASILIRAYRVRGHLEADLDPLGLTKPT